MTKFQAKYLLLITSANRNKERLMEIIIQIYEDGLRDGKNESEGNNG